MGPNRSQHALLNCSDILRGKRVAIRMHVGLDSVQVITYMIKAII